MKRKGSTCDFVEERNAELLKAYRRNFMRPDLKSLMEVYEAAANSEAPRFYVSECRAVIVYRYWKKYGRLPVAVGSRRKMFHLIAERADSILAANPDCTDRDAVANVIYSPAPTFFLSPLSVKTIIHKLRS